MTAELATRAAFEELTASLDTFRESVEGAFRARERAKIWCRACGGTRDAVVTRQPRDGTWINLLEGMICEGCGLNGRMRLVLKVLDELYPGGGDREAMVFERYTPLFPHLQKRFPRLVGSEFVPGGHVPGSIVRLPWGGEVRHEDLMALSMADRSLDLVMHFDVLEHVPESRRALSECFRVLRPGGRVVFTLPFYNGLERNIVRAELVGGELVHRMPPVYHGNPVDAKGALVFIHPSWELLEAITAAGFEALRMMMGFDPVEGILSCSCPYPDGQVWPLVFVAERPGGP